MAESGGVLREGNNFSHRIALKSWIVERIMFWGTSVMKKLALAIAALVVTTLGASAADLPARTYTKAPPMVDPVYNWTGFYVGINGGYDWGRSNHTNTGTLITTGDFDTNGGVVGGTYGFNWQTGHFVLGFEGDYDWAHANGVGGVGLICGTGCFTNLTSIGTDRVRLGWDINSWLLYGTAGLAFGHIDAGIVGCAGGTCGSVNRTGWTAGVGIEKMFYRNWSAKLEYLHYDLGTANGVYFPLITVTSHGDMVRAGVNYHFNWMQPVVAKY
jgi:outer membrane immunogenic protein